jgi:hypothetical protein
MSPLFPLDIPHLQTGLDAIETSSREMDDHGRREQGEEH